MKNLSRINIAHKALMEKDFQGVQWRDGILTCSSDLGFGNVQRPLLNGCTRLPVRYSSSQKIDSTVARHDSCIFLILYDSIEAYYCVDCGCGKSPALHTQGTLRTSIGGKKDTSRKDHLQRIYESARIDVEQDVGDLLRMFP